MSRFHSIRESRRGIGREATCEPALGLFEAIAAWLGRRRLCQDLSDLDDRLLDDVGISREDMPWKAAKSIWYP